LVKQSTVAKEHCVMKWMLTWVLGGQVAGYSLPDQLLYDDEAQCQKAADVGIGCMHSGPREVR
jgi:hypothetical protein